MALALRLSCLGVVGANGLTDQPPHASRARAPMVEEIRSALVRHTLWIRGIAQNFEHIPRTSYAEVRHALAHPNMRLVY